MKQFVIKQKIGNSMVEILPHVIPEGFSKVDSFDVEVKCLPAYNQGADKLMQEVCSILSSLDGGKTEIKTFKVVSSVFMEGANCDIKSICFQVITLLCPHWYR